MNILISILAPLFVLQSNLCAQPSDDDLKQYTKEVAEILRGAIWDVSENGTTVRLESNFDID